jgi:hypothetical protein
VAQLVDAKTETVCRVLAQLLPPRSRNNRPVRAAPDWRADSHPTLAMA